MASVGITPGGELRRPEFWLTQLAHQAPMIASMVLMFTVLRSALGVLAILAGLWIVALARARAARTSLAARELLIDLAAMGLALLIPFLQASPGARLSGGMAGMSGMSGVDIALPTVAWAALILIAWAVARLLLRRAPIAHGTAPLRSLVSGSCCAIGLVAMFAF